LDDKDKPVPKHAPALPIWSSVATLGCRLATFQAKRLPTAATGIPMRAASDGLLEKAMPALHIPALTIVLDHSARVSVLVSALATAVPKSASITTNVKRFIYRHSITGGFFGKDCVRNNPRVTSVLRQESIGSGPTRGLLALAPN